MDDVFKQVKTYRFTSSISDRLRLLDAICAAVRTDLRLFVLASVRPPAADDVMQETLKDIALGLPKFVGDSKEQFWKWCYTIARNEISNHFRKQKKERTQPMPEHELRELIDLSIRLSPPSGEVKHDLEHAMKLITASRPECYDFLWKHYVFGLAYDEIAAEQHLTYDGVRMKITRCLEEAKSLIS